MPVNQKFTELTEDTTPTGDDLVAVANDPAGTPGSKKVTLANVTKALSVVVGDSGSGGTKGLVPAPGAGDAAANKFLKADGTFAVPATGGSGGIGDVVGPASATDNALARFDSTTGKLIQNSTVTLDDTGAITVPEMAAPATPAAGKVAVYAKSDGKLYIKDDAGTETDLAGGGGGSIGGSTGATDNRVIRADGTGGSTVQSSAVSIDDSGNVQPATSGASNLGDNSFRWNQLYANDVIATGGGAAGGRIRFFGSGGNAAEIASSTNRKSLFFVDGINGNPGTICLRDHTPAQFGANQNDYTEEGGNSAAALRWSSNASRDVTGLSISQTGGDIHLIINIGSNDIVLKHEDSNSSAANRFLCSTGADITLTANQAADIWYDGTTQRWRVWKKA
jgi:hypothetical protein